MTYASTTVRRGTRLVTQLVIAALAIAATVLFSNALQHSTSRTSRTGHESSPATSAPPHPADPAAVRR
ncbi:hypothetical protein AB0L57_25260 [Nocardia sp. NPDC052254]|uniref:hypothetical protein n=1 Tax=Nocardia sp. NPDC052254 TaxID=3155681 RepID=UPI00343FB8C3